MKKKIAVLTSGWAHSFIMDFLNGMQRATKDKNTDIYLFCAYNYVESSGMPNSTGYSVFSLINYEEYDGIIILSDLINHTRILERERLKILKSGKPAISINRKIEGISCINIDNYSGFYEIIDHLIKVHGAKDLAFLGGKETNVDFAERYKAYRTALLDNQLKIDLEKVYSIEISNYSLSYNFFKNHILSGNPLPEVLVCSNDQVALGVLKACEENDIHIPEQMKIVGYDDIPYSKNINPALTTVRSNAEQVGFEAVNRVLGESKEVVSLKLKSSAIFRHSCGCEVNIVQKQVQSNLSFLNEINKGSELLTQIEKMEDVFTDSSDVFSLLTNLESFFSKSHHFEGENFCVFLKSDWTSVLINSEENLPQNLSYGPNVQSVICVHNNKKNIREVVSTQSLIPLKFISLEQSSLFCIMPIFHHLYVHGYYITKNNTAMLSNNYGYTWTKTFGNSIERFRRRNMYKVMGQQYLKLSTKDALSGMLNRIGLEKLAKPFYAENKKNGLTTVLFFVDINSMKTINDKFGHLHGDLAVKTISAAVLEVIPKTWLGIRYGGDEFLVVGSSKNYNGEDYCQLIGDRISKKTSVMQLPYNLSASIGTISVPSDSEWTLEEAVEEVDKIMYAKKQAFHEKMGDRH